MVTQAKFLNGNPVFLRVVSCHLFLPVLPAFLRAVSVTGFEHSLCECRTRNPGHLPTFMVHPVRKSADTWPTLAMVAPHYQRAGALEKLKKALGVSQISGTNKHRDLGGTQGLLESCACISLMVFDQNKSQQEFRSRLQAICRPKHRPKYLPFSSSFTFSVDDTIAIYIYMYSCIYPYRFGI